METIKNQKISITKTTVECYKLRGENFSWADITIDSNGNTGRIQIASDFGDWQNYWGACGMPFKEFLIKLNIDYIANKFGTSKWFDLDKTISFQKERIEEYASNENKKELISELNQLKNSSCKEEYIHIMQSCDSIMDFEDNQPELCYSIDPGFKRFWNDIWPIFLDAIKNELLEIEETI